MDNKKRLIDLANEIEKVEKLPSKEKNKKLNELGIMSMSQARRTKAMAEQIRQLKTKERNK
jgi:hypothetical protein